MTASNTTDCKNILIIEDDEDIRESMKDALKIEGYNISTARNGQEGLDVLKKDGKSCLILLDMIMPGMSGREFLDIIKTNPVLSHIPVFIHSAIVNKENSQGAIGFIRKPADLEEILKIVKAHCC